MRDHPHPNLANETGVEKASDGGADREWLRTPAESNARARRYQAPRLRTQSARRGNYCRACQFYPSKFWAL
jgi:hypothetical protein